jgi:hypothetical protein
MYGKMATTLAGIIPAFTANLIMILESHDMLVSSMNA